MVQAAHTRSVNVWRNEVRYLVHKSFPHVEPDQSPPRAPNRFPLYILRVTKADSTRALKTRRLKRHTKRVVTPTEFSNEELCKNSRSNLDERFWLLQFGVSSALSVSNAAGGVSNARARNAVQSTRKRFIRLSQRGVCARCSMLKNLFARWRRAHPYTMYSVRNIRTERWRQHAGRKSVELCMKTGAKFLPPPKTREVSKFSLCWFLFM